MRRRRRPSRHLAERSVAQLIGIAGSAGRHPRRRPPGGQRTTTPTDKTAEITRLGCKQTAVKLDAGTADALSSLGRGPHGHRKFDAGTGTVSLPISDGFVAIHSDKSYKPGYIAGNVIHQGSGRKFSKGNQSIDVTEFVCDPETSVLTATAGGMAGTRCVPGRHERRRVDVRR